MFMFDRKLWAQNKERFTKSYKNICPQIRQIGYAEMTDHQFLKEDRSVQQTTFATGHRVTVNFGSAVYLLPDGTRVEPLSYTFQQ